MKLSREFAHSAFERHALRDPGAMAVACRDVRATYGALDAGVDRFFPISVKTNAGRCRRRMATYSSYATISSSSAVIRFPVFGGDRPCATPLRIDMSLRAAFDAPTIESDARSVTHESRGRRGGQRVRIRRVHLQECFMA
jgi:hypothetical protein